MNKIFKNLWLIRWLPWTIYFNFHYFPFKTAIYLPIWLNRPKFKQLKGSISIKGKIKTGMIKLGKYIVSTIPNTGIIIDIEGEIIFNGNLVIGNSSAICVGKHGSLNFGRNVCITAANKFSCFKSIEIGDDSLISWNNEFYDTDFHVLDSIDNQKIRGGVCSNFYWEKLLDWTRMQVFERSVFA